MGEHFRRQHVILDYIPDFVCLSKQLIIEIDGGYHLEGEQPQRDEERTEELMKISSRKNSGMTISKSISQVSL